MKPNSLYIFLSFIPILCLQFVNGGPPLQSEVPIGLDSPKDTLGKRHSHIQEEDKLAYLQVLDESYRLPLSVQPIHYDLEIRPILDDDEPGKRFTAPGNVSIRVKCHEQTRSITLHSKGIQIEHDQVTVLSLEPEGYIPTQGYSIDEARSFYIIQLEENLEIGKDYVVNIPFTSNVSQNSLNGLYLSSYKKDDGDVKYLATTQFQKADASRAFPCFDEPSEAFRATFNVKIGRKRVGYHSLANTERVGEPEEIPGLDGWVWDKHNTTVNMPVYLVAIIVSDFKSETAPEELYRKPVRTWAAPPLMTETSGKFSAQAVARMLKFFEDYFDYPYQLNKMDSVAVPDFAAGAMENWGLNTYRTNLMVWFEMENTFFERWRSAAVTSHELVHQWFGNLVTCEWWNDTWLNEGFARYLQFIGANYSGEDFRSLDRYVIDVTQLSMAYDEQETTEPVHSNVTDRIVNQASRVVYEKAAGLIRMMQHFLTEETLIKGLRNYLKRHQYGGVVQDNLFQALTEQAQEDQTFTDYTVKEVMDTWTLQSGFPIIRVSRVDSQRLYLSQERFRMEPVYRNNQDLWYVPIAYVSSSNPDFSPENTKPKAWIDNKTILQTLTVNSTSEWIIINPDARGFYRVIYDNYLTRLIQSQLEEDHTKISFGSRSQLIDDYFRSASAKYINIQSALDMTRYLRNEDDFIVWTTVVNNLTPLYTRLQDTDALEDFRRYVLSLVVPPLERIGSNQGSPEPAPIIILRTQLLDWSCSLSHEICRETADQLFSQWLETPPSEWIPIATDIQPMIYCGAVASSNNPGNRTIQDFLLQEYGRNRGDRQQSLIVNALACEQSTENLGMLLEKAVDTSEENELVVGKHGLQILQNVARNEKGREVLWDFVVERESDIRTALGDRAVPSVISALAPYLSSRSVSGLNRKVEEYTQNYLAQPNLPADIRNTLEGALSTIEQNSRWMSYYYNDVKNWLVSNK